MQMDVEIYDLTEVSLDQTPESLDAEAIGLIQELELKGQEKLIKGTDTPKLCRYQQINDEQAFIIRVLFSSHKNISTYEHGPIPVRVLKEVKWAKEYFEALYVLYAPPVEVVDPILVGSNGYFHLGNLSTVSLIARWGDALESWDNLFKKAMTRYRKMVKTQLQIIKTQCDMQLGLLETNDPINLRDVPEVSNLPFNER